MSLNPSYPEAHLPLLGRGAVIIDIFDANGLHTGFQPMGNCSAFTLSNSDDKAELYGSMQASSARIASTVTKRNLSIKITGTDFAARNLSIGTMGTLSDYTQAATAVTAEALASVTAVKKGRYFQTAKRNIATVTVKQDSTTLVAGTDYVIADAASGLIYFPLAGAVDDSKAVAIDYTPAAILNTAPLKQIAGFTKSKVTGHVKYVPDPADGPKIECDVWKVNLTLDGELGLISDDYGNWSLAGEVLNDAANHANSPYYLMTYL